jgi:hypothetical protein
MRDLDSDIVLFNSTLCTEDTQADFKTNSSLRQIAWPIDIRGFNLHLDWSDHSNNPHSYEQSKAQQAIHRLYQLYQPAVIIVIKQKLRNLSVDCVNVASLHSQFDRNIRPHCQFFRIFIKGRAGGGGRGAEAQDLEPQFRVILGPLR